MVILRPFEKWVEGNRKRRLPMLLLLRFDFMCRLADAGHSKLPLRSLYPSYSTTIDTLCQSGFLLFLLESNLFVMLLAKSGFFW